jgi:hypothetical protein
MAKYTLSRSNVANSTSNDLLTLISASARKLRLLEILVVGMGTTSTALEVAVFRSTGGTTGGGALTPAKLDTDTANQAFTNFTTWSVQPTLSGDPVIPRQAFNANGGIMRFVCSPRDEVLIRNGEQFSVRGVLGAGNLSLGVVVEEP